MQTFTIALAVLIVAGVIFGLIKRWETRLTLIAAGLLMACISLWLTKSEKNTFGISENNMAIPPVNKNEMPINFILDFTFSGSSNSVFSANIASKGMVNSATTSIEATVRNLAYMGT